MDDTEEIQIEQPIKTKKPRPEKQIEAFAKALQKKKELSEINTTFNDCRKQKKEDVIEHRKRIIKKFQQGEVEVELEKPEFEKKTKKLLPVPIVSSSDEESESRKLRFSGFEFRAEGVGARHSFRGPKPVLPDAVPERES